MAEKLLDVRNLRTHFFTRAGVVKAIEDVSFYLAPGETLGLVGESGCGKSVTSLSVMRLVEDPPGKTPRGWQKGLFGTPWELWWRYGNRR